MSKFNTTLIHGGKIDDNNTGAINTPVYNSSTYVSPKFGADVRWDYERSGNPTRASLEQLLAKLENGAGAFAFASGMAAITAAFSLFKPGDNIVIGDNIYGGTFRYINDYLKPNGVTFTSVDTRDSAAVEKAISSETKAIYFETVTNPLLQLTDVRQITAIAKKHNILTVIDNTFLSPYLQQPLNLGADVVIHSATKYLAGHSDLVAGVVVAKDKDVADQIYNYQNTTGAVLPPQECSILQRGIQTLAVRMDRHLFNVEKVIEFLESDSRISKIHYPGHDGDKNFDSIKDECKGFGGVLSFELNPGLNAKEFVNHIKVISFAVSLGAVESLAEVPAFQSHAEIPREERLKVGITDELIRLSIGLEDYHDLIDDLKQALDFV
ncbi:trans-sulfuration enzyme family protein [Companilactobacillus keshanensis]|uniref:Trans-sulfuration enzyme family protein n=1 Tax=Companilactobacillus keshanensis TaxID=2486003 RepID=A0ABW4BSL6_9LACO|nr:PLP-dependent aspartate aminotransferase family protein [Companilactobacillus keshanensis]